MTILSVVMLTALIVFLCIEKGKNRRINISPTKAGIIYLLFPVVYTIAVTVNLLLMHNNFFADESIAGYLASSSESSSEYFKTSVNWSYAINLIIQAVISIPVTIMSLSGAFASTARGCSEYSDKQKWTRLPFAAAVMSTVSAVAAIAFIVITVLVGTGETITTVITIALVALLLVVFTLGLALIVLIFIAPGLIIGIGAYVIIITLPFILSAYAWCCCFAVLHIISAMMSVYVSIRLKKEGIFTKKNMIISCILSLIPVVNMFSSINTNSKIRLFYNN